MEYSTGCEWRQRRKLSRKFAQARPSKSATCPCKASQVTQIFALSGKSHALSKTVAGKIESQSVRGLRQVKSRFVIRAHIERHIDRQHTS